MCRRAVLFSILLLSVFLIQIQPLFSQTVTGTIQGRVMDASGAVLPGATVTAQNEQTGLVRSVVSDDSGEYRLPLLPVGRYTVSAELPGFRKEIKQSVALTIGEVKNLDFTLQVGAITEELVVESRLAEVELEPTRTQTSSVIDEVQIQNLPVNGRQFIDFALLAPGVTIGETTSGSTDVIIEPVTKLSFAGQNIHFNFIAVDGADAISTASGVQRSSPSQEAVREFRVINSNFSLEFGRAVGGIVNIITRSGTNEFHGSVYNFLRNDKLDATSILSTPELGLDELRQNQFGFTLGGPLVRDRSFFFGNYEGQRRGESPFYNSAVLSNIEAINEAKVNVYKLRPENLNVLRTRDTDNFLVRVDHAATDKHHLFVRYFFDDQRARNLSPLNDGFDLPSAFKNNFLRDQSLVANFTSTLSPTLLNEFRGQFGRRSFDFPTTTTEPHLEVTNLFTTGVNRGNPDFYRESRLELIDNVTVHTGNHTVMFGGNYNFVRTTESFPLFIPFEAGFPSVDAFLTGSPAVIFFQQFNPSPTFPTSLFFGERFPQEIVDKLKGTLDHTYNGLFIQDKWQLTSKLTLNYGVRWEFETWPDGVLDTDWNNVDPRFGFAYNVGARKMVIRGGIGIFHGIIPSPLLMSQPSIGGTRAFPGREQKQNELNGAAPIFVFASAPQVMPLVLQDLMTKGLYPTSALGFLGEFPVVRFARDHQAPYGIQGTLSLAFEVLPDTSLQSTYLVTRGVHLGSFFNVNHLPQPLGKLPSGKDDFCFFRINRFICAGPGGLDPSFALYFEADSRWNSIYHGWLLDINRRFRDYFGLGISYTFSKTIDDGPNPSFVLMPENPNRFDLERAISSDDVRHRFVANLTLATPTQGHPLARDWKFGFIVSLNSPHHFTKFAGFDANGDGFPVNDRVGLDGRNTFKGDPFKSVDVRLARSFPIGERVRAEFLAEAFNLFNTLNIRFFNTVYGDSIFNPPGTPGTFLEGARNPFFGSPRAIFNPRQIQFALKITW